MREYVHNSWSEVSEYIGTRPRSDYEYVPRARNKKTDCKCSRVDSHARTTFSRIHGRLQSGCAIFTLDDDPVKGRTHPVDRRLDLRGFSAAPLAHARGKREYPWYTRRRLVRDFFISGGSHIRNTTPERDNIFSVGNIHRNV